MGPVLIIGSTGMVGKALIREAELRGIEAYGIARKNAQFNIDITDTRLFKNTINTISPKVIINTAALINIDECEKNPELAYKTNAKTVSTIVESIRNKGIKFIQISTDHYFTGDQDYPHRETDPINLINEYACTKYAGEAFSLTLSDSLVLRTNVIGIKNDLLNPSFGDWIIDSLLSHKPITLFSDAFHSPIHVSNFASFVFDHMVLKTKGLLNLAGSEVISKKSFIEKIASVMNIELDWAEIGTITSLSVPRAESLGLDVRCCENILSKKLPNALDAAERLVMEYEEN